MQTKFNLKEKYPELEGIVSGQMWMRLATAGFDVGWLLTGKSAESQDLEITRLNIIIEELRSLLRK